MLYIDSLSFIIVCYVFIKHMQIEDTKINKIWILVTICYLISISLIGYDIVSQIVNYV